MRSKVVDVDIRHLKPITGIEDSDTVDILFRDGREPLGRVRIQYDGQPIDPDKLQPLIDNLPSPSPLYPPEDSLPTIAVAICTLNRPRELAGALRSLDRQKYPAQEIIVVDNGCQEKIRELVAGIIPNARYLPETSRGLDFARNRALSAATCDIIAFLDDDTEADSFWVRSLAECFAAFPGAGAVTGLVLPLELETDAQEMFEANGGFGRGFTRRVLPQDRLRRFGLRLPLIADSIGVGSGCNMAFRKTVLKQLNGFDEALDTGSPLPGGGDLDVFYRVMRAGHQLVYEPRALVRHRHRRSETEVRAQLTGYQRSLTAFLVKTLGFECGWTFLGVALFLFWRLAKTSLRLFRGLVGNEVLPFSLLARMLFSSFVGFGSYHKSKWRVRRLAAQKGFPAILHE